MRIVAATREQFPAILALNAAFVEKLAPLSLERLALIDSRATYHRVALDERNELAGFLLALGWQAPHDGINFRWFAERFADFLYVDRIVVTARHQRTGVGSLLYQDLFTFGRAEGYEHISCEIDAQPPNPKSDRFHARFGFREVGTQEVEHIPGNAKRVSLQMAPVRDRGC
jgi:predicted GNAT superfamily acetyltransferase